MDDWPYLHDSWQRSTERVGASGSGALAHVVEVSRRRAQQFKAACGL